MAILYIYILFMQINFYWLQYIPLLYCDVGLVSELRLTAGCVLMDLASLAVSGTSVYANGLNAQLNPICYLLALLGAHHILHVSRIRVKSEGCNMKQQGMLLNAQDFALIR